MGNEKKDIVIPDISEEDALQELKKGYGKAEQLLQSKDKIEEFLQKIERNVLDNSNHSTPGHLLAVHPSPSRTGRGVHHHDHRSSVHLDPEGLSQTDHTS